MFAKCVGGHRAIGVKRMDGWMGGPCQSPSLRKLEKLLRL